MAPPLRRAAVFGMLWIVLVDVSVFAQRSEVVDQLTKKYTWGSIYLTYSNLADLAYLLNSPKRAEIQKTIDPAVLGLIGDFVKRHGSLRMAEGIAFLQLDLANSRAGYMSIAQYEGAVTPLPWSSEQVRAVALFADRFLGNASNISKLAADLLSTDQKRDVTVEWAQLQELKGSAYTTSTQAQQLDVAFRGALKLNEAGMASLRQTDAAFYRELRQFAERIDKDVGADEKAQALTEARVNFQAGRYDLSSDGRAALDQFADKVKALNEQYFVEIQGHTDSVGSKRYNEDLGARRAKAIGEYLTKVHEVPLNRMSMISYGDSQPVASNKTKEGRARNRRVVLVVLE
jgi:outer membrane protein OmpA-like peptidoglycan-associated protein